MSVSPDILRTEDVPLDAIEPTLRALWRSLSEGVPADGHVPVTRVIWWCSPAPIRTPTRLSSFPPGSPSATLRA
jgi:hypothetical protein